MGDFVVALTHDVDRVRKTFQYFTHDLLRWKPANLKSLVSKANPYWCFEQIMELEDTMGVRSTFFFLEESIPLRLWPPKNWLLSLGRYHFDETDVVRIIRALDEGGWEIGLHGSYKSFVDRALLETEKQHLEEVLGKQVIGIRQHHLNLCIPETWCLQKQVGFLYDASYGKKDGIGFLDRKESVFIDATSGMFVLPLALMDGCLFATESDLDHAWDLVQKLIQDCQTSQGFLSVLWHQRFFNEDEFPGYCSFYRRIIEECRYRNAEFLTCKEIFYRKYNEEKN